MEGDHVQPKNSEDPGCIYLGSDINVQGIRNSIKNGINACLKDCQEFEFPFFMEVSLEAIPRVSRKVSGYDEGGSDTESDSDTEDMDESHEDNDFGPQYLTTSMGRMHVKTAEAIYFNGGKTTFGAKSRKSRFYSGFFSEKSSFVDYNDSKTCCEDVVQKGDTVLATIHVADSDIESDSDSTGSNVQQIEGEVRFICKNHTPMRYFCKEHHKPPVNVWVWRDGKPVRCVFP